MCASKQIIWSAFALAPLCAVGQHDAAQHRLEEVFITAEFEKASTETALPLSALSGEALRKALGETIGETLAHQPGVRSASFGAGVGLPVIRGQSGRRVSVVQNGISAFDAAAGSPDHASSVNPLVAERIEIIRGPATLLYGNGAIGGVVNVIDNRIPESQPEALAGAVELRHRNVTSEQAGAFKLDDAIGSFVWHLDGAYRDSGNTRIPGHAMSDSVLENDHDEHDEAHPEEEFHTEVENTHGYIANSDSRSQSLAAGGSWIGERGFAGLAVSQLRKAYGLPPGSHLHGAEEAPHEEEAEHAEASDIRIDLERTRYQLKAGLDLAGFFERLNLRLAHNRYQHVEVSQSPSHNIQDQNARFSNRGTEVRVTGHHERDLAQHLAWHGVLGTQVSDSRVAMAGDEGFIPATDIRSTGIFALESLTTGRWIYELGARLEQVHMTPENGCNRRDSIWSASAGAVWQARESLNLSVSAGRAQRSAGVEERYSNLAAAGCTLAAQDQRKVHSPTGLVELGNPDLGKETSNNLELRLHKHLGRVHGEVSLYLNRVTDYIYLSEAEISGEEPVAHYRQHDAEFRGYEANLSWPLELSATRHLELKLFSDGVNAELTTGEYLPRIPPRQLGFEVEFTELNWSINLRVADVASADRLAPGEPPSEGYRLMDISADYHFDGDRQNLLLFVEGSNLLDETIRNHTSFAKELAPEPGRGIELGLRLSF